MFQILNQTLFFVPEVLLMFPMEAWTFDSHYNHKNVIVNFIPFKKSINTVRGVFNCENQ